MQQDIEQQCAHARIFRKNVEISEDLNLNHETSESVRSLSVQLRAYGDLGLMRYRQTRYIAVEDKRLGDSLLGSEVRCCTGGIRG